MKPSYRVKNGLNSHLRQSQKEHAQSNPNVQFIVAAEFDNKSGPVIKHQYPKTIPGFRTVGNDSLSSHLASLMIPNSVENHPGKADFTVFVLYKYQNMYQLFPVSSNKDAEKALDAASIIEEEALDEEQEDSFPNGNLDSGLANNGKQTHEPPLFFLSVVNTLLDKNNDRGAYIKAIALGTTMTNFYTFKPLLTMVLDYYMSSNTNDVRILIDCFDMINSLDLSLVTRFHSNTILQSILNSINDEDITSKIFDPQESSLPNILRVNELPRKDRYGNEIQFKKRVLQYKFSTFIPKVLPAYFTKIPLQIDLIKHDNIKIETNYNHSILKLLLRLIPMFKELNDSEFSWRLMINSTQSSKDELCQFVIALSNLINGFSSDYFDGSSICIFPYMEISIIDVFRENFTGEFTKGKFFSVAGVSNPIFQYQVDVWDYYYDMDTDILIKSKSLSPEEKNKVKTQGIRSIFSRYTSSQEQVNKQNRAKLHTKEGLMTLIINLLIKGQHDNETVLNTLKRASILQLLHLINNGRDGINGIEMTLKDQYIINYKDLIVFPDIFEYNSLKVLNLLNNLELDISKIFWPNITNTYQIKKRLLLDLYKHLKQLHKFISVNKKNLGKFLNIAMNYPLVSAFDGINIAQDDLADLNIEKLLASERSSMKSIDSLYDGSAPNDTIDHFNTYKAFNLLLLPLFLNPQLEHDDSSFLGGLGPPAPLMRLSTGRNYNYQSDSSLSMISSIYETNDIMSHDVNYENSLIDDATTIFTTKSNIPDLSSLINKCRQMSIKILYRIQRHHIGRLIVNSKLNPLFRVTYQTAKQELFNSSDNTSTLNHSNGHTLPQPNQYLPSTPPVSVDAIKPRNSLRNSTASSPKLESSMKLSVSRRDLLKDLSLLNVDSETNGLPALTNTPNRHDLLESLAKLEISPKQHNNL
ncbi:hypothetical protein C6P41_003122 [Kluyveromyces marxianus]|nr:hypothetical protein C6P41_003122 [Kluyveromyces marxianus]